MYLLLAEQVGGNLSAKVCGSCGNFFVPASRDDQTTCGPACKQRLYRERNKDRLRKLRAERTRPKGATP